MITNNKKVLKAINIARTLLLAKRSLSKSVTIYKQPKIVKNKTLIGKCEPAKYTGKNDFDMDFDLFFAELSVMVVKDSIFISRDKNDIVVQYEDYTEDICKALNGVI